METAVSSVAAVGLSAYLVSISSSLGGPRESRFTTGRAMNIMLGNGSFMSSEAMPMMASLALLWMSTGLPFFVTWEESGHQAQH